MELHLRKASDGLHVVSGQMRLQAALALSGEVKVEAPGIGDVLIVKTPGKRGSHAALALGTN